MLNSLNPHALRPALHPSRTIHNDRQLVRARQAPESTVTVVSTSIGTGDNGGNGRGLSGGAIAGIVIGSVAGFLLLLWVLRSCTNLGAPPNDEREAWYQGVEPVRHHHRHRQYHGHRPHRDRYHAGVYTTTTVAEPVPVVVRSNSRRRRSSTSKARSPRRSGSAYAIDEQRGRTGRYYESY